MYIDIDIVWNGNVPFSLPPPLSLPGVVGRTEGVSYRIKQRLQSYNMEPVSALVKECIASSKVHYLYVHLTSL